MCLQTLLRYAVLIAAALLANAAGPGAAAARGNALAAISPAQTTVNAILLGPEFSIFFSGFEN